MIQPETNPEDAKAVATHLRTQSDAELSQAIASPRVLVGSLPGFTLDHLRTAAEGTVLQLARDEQTRSSGLSVDFDLFTESMHCGKHFPTAFASSWVTKGSR